MTESTTIRWEQDETGVVTLVLDDPDQSANTMNQAFKDSLAAVADRAEAEKDTIRGIIFTSAKKTFFAGGDLKDMIRIGPDNAQDAFDAGSSIKRSLRRIETLGKPVVAAINGAALGGGYEIALACHHRVALDAPGSKIGLPEVTLGLLPAGGGVTRTVRLHGHRRRAAEGAAPGHPVHPAAGAGERPRPRGRRHPRGDARQGPRLHRRQPRVAAALGRQGLPDPRRHPVPPEVRRQPARPSPPTSRSRSAAPPTRRRATSSPRPSRARRSTSRPRRPSRPATSPSWSPARSPRT